MAVTQTTRLGCGREVEEVWAHVDEPPTPHEQTCPDCTKARADLAELSAATLELRDADRDDPDLRVPEGLLSDLLAIVRTEVRRGRLIPLERDQDDEPALTVSEQVIAAVVRESCDGNADVEARRVSVEATAPDPGSTGPVDLTVHLQASVRAGTPIPSLTASLRDTIRDDVGARIGVTVARVDITVEDVHDA